MINKISYYIVTFPTIAMSPNKVRGYVGRLFKDNKAYHNHTDLGFDYIYPQVQYRLIDENNLIFLLINPKDIFNISKINKTLIPSLNILLYNGEIGECSNQILYKFKSPFIALNQTNTMKYNNVKDKNELLQSIIIGNVISLSKSFNIKVLNELKVEYLKLDKCLLKIKGIQMIGFTGEFSINYLIPNKFSIGKYKSIGYGVL